MSTAPNTSHQNVIPPAVRANAEKAEAMMRSLAEGKAPSDAPANEPPPAAAPAPASTEPPVVTQQVTETPPPATPDNTFTQPETPPPAPTPTPQADPDNWEQKFRSELGRNKAIREENSRLLADNAALAAELDTLRRQMASPDFGFQPGQRLVTDEEIAEYGEDFMNVVEKKAKEIAAPLLQEVSDLKARVDGVTVEKQVNAREKMFDTLDQTHPNWREINRKPEFINWLKTSQDELSGQNLKVLLDSAVERNDATRVGRFVTRFLQEHPTFAPQATVQPVQDPLEQLAAPGRAKSAGTPVTAPQGADKPFIKASDITKFYSDVTRNVYRGREEEQRRMEVMIHEANRDGRVLTNQ